MSLHISSVLDQLVPDNINRATEFMGIAPPPSETSCYLDTASVHLIYLN